MKALALMQQVNRLSKIATSKVRAEVGSRLGITPDEMELLSRIYQHQIEGSDPVPLSLLRTNCTRAELLSRRIHTLYAKGLIDRTGNATDLRKVNVCIPESKFKAIKDEVTHYISVHEKLLGDVDGNLVEQIKKLTDGIK